jgi:hypothetical protein
MYIWEPYNGFQADHYVNESVAPGQSESAGGKLTMPTGLNLLDVLAVGDSQYQLSIAQDAAVSIAAAHTTAKVRPQHPLVLSDPLSAGVVRAPQELPAYRAFLPVLTK